MATSKNTASVRILSFLSQFNNLVVLENSIEGIVLQTTTASIRTIEAKLKEAGAKPPVLVSTPNSGPYGTSTIKIIGSTVGTKAAAWKGYRSKDGLKKNAPWLYPTK